MHDFCHVIDRLVMPNKQLNIEPAKNGQWVRTFSRGSLLPHKPL